MSFKVVGKRTSDLLYKLENKKNPITGEVKIKLSKTFKDIKGKGKKMPKKGCK